MNTMSKDTTSCSRKSDRIPNRQHYSRNVAESNLLSHLETFNFIDQPTIVTKASDGSQHAIWNGIKKSWNDTLNMWGVKTTKNLKKRFCFPRGSSPYSLTAEDIEQLSRKAGNSMEYLAEYDLMLEKSNRERLLAHKNKQKENIIIDTNPRLEKKLGYPSDVWIGARVNSLHAETITGKSNCHLEIIGFEHKDERDYPYCRYYQFVVLDEDLPADTWLLLPSNNPFKIRQLGGIQSKVSVKRKTANSATSNYEYVANKKKLKISKNATKQCLEEESKDIAEVSVPTTTAATKKKRNYLVVQDDEEEENQNQLFKSLELLATVVTTTAKPIVNTSSLTPILTDLKSNAINNSSNPILTSINECPTDQQSNPIISNNSSNNPTQTPINACPNDQLSSPIIPNNSSNPQTPIIDGQSSPLNNDDLLRNDVDIHTYAKQLSLEDILRMMQTVLTHSIDGFVPARVHSSMTILNESGEFEPRVMKPNYTRIEQEEMIKTLASVESNLKLALRFLDSN